MLSITKTFSLFLLLWNYMWNGVGLFACFFLKYLLKGKCTYHLLISLRKKSEDFKLYVGRVLAVYSVGTESKKGCC